MEDGGYTVRIGVFWSRITADCAIYVVGEQNEGPQAKSRDKFNSQFNQLATQLAI